MGDEKLRLFTAIRVPRPHLEWLDAATRSLRTLPGARWTDVDNQHVTLNFLGWTGAGLLGEVAAAIQAVAARHAPAPVTISGLGAFPRERRARVLWAGLDDPEGLLAALASDLGDELRGVGYEPEERGYTAHLTLARFKVPRPLDGLLPPLPEPPGPFEVDRVTLFRSRLAPSGARYEVLGESYLTGGGDDAGRSH